jgi:hypothetical protein
MINNSSIEAKLTSNVNGKGFLDWQKSLKAASSNYPLVYKAVGEMKLPDESNHPDLTTNKAFVERNLGSASSPEEIKLRLESNARQGVTYRTHKAKFCNQVKESLSPDLWGMIERRADKPFQENDYIGLIQVIEDFGLLGKSAWIDKAMDDLTNPQRQTKLSALNENLHKNAAILKLRKDKCDSGTVTRFARSYLLALPAGYDYFKQAELTKLASNPLVELDSLLDLTRDALEWGAINNILETTGKTTTVAMVVETRRGFKPSKKQTGGNQARDDIKCFRCGGDHVQMNCPTQCECSVCKSNKQPARVYQSHTVELHRNWDDHQKKRLAGRSTTPQEALHVETLP